MRLYIAWYPKINSQNKHINGVIEQYFEVNYLQNNWPDWLLLAEIVGNNTQFKITKVITFFINKEFHL